MESFPGTSIETYKTLARTWAATVTVVTTRRGRHEGAGPELDGFTATAFITVSMTPLGKMARTREFHESEK